MKINPRKNLMTKANYDDLIVLETFIDYISWSWNSSQGVLEGQVSLEIFKKYGKNFTQNNEEIKWAASKRDRIIIYTANYKIINYENRVIISLLSINEIFRGDQILLF
ncbi:hypothetical protein [Gloeothece verrucosa]|uniref:Uncharacterized protein n=1 Tax=Gloeothece verrucosa (strain PCC 7822) TaxID=497965 RepID=E0UNI5_GLOV7|nr:hypothetical protein [Gloeothece verrucosa]ADN18515.1 hypothetical protein Cyan7822_6869 [Gloeothece verrucosa PCC 7822]